MMGFVIVIGLFLLALGAALKLNEHNQSNNLYAQVGISKVSGNTNVSDTVKALVLIVCIYWFCTTFLH